MRVLVWFIPLFVIREQKPRAPALEQTSATTSCIHARVSVPREHLHAAPFLPLWETSPLDVLPEPEAWLGQVCSVGGGEVAESQHQAIYLGFLLRESAVILDFWAFCPMA